MRCLEKKDASAAKPLSRKGKRDSKPLAGGCGPASAPPKRRRQQQKNQHGHKKQNEAQHQVRHVLQVKETRLCRPLHFARQHPSAVHCRLTWSLISDLPGFVKFLALMKQEAHHEECDACCRRSHPCAQQAGNQSDARAGSNGDPGRPLAAHIEHHRPRSRRRHPQQSKDAHRGKQGAQQPAGTASIRAARRAGFQSTSLASRTASLHRSGWACPGLAFRRVQQVAADRRQGSSSHLSGWSGGSGCR